MIFKKPANIPSQPVDEHKKIYIPKLWPYRLLGNIFILTCIGFFCFGVFIIKSNIVSQKLTSFSEYFFQTTLPFGFGVEDIIIHGRAQTPVEEVNNILNSHYANNILDIDIHQLKQDLERLPWVKHAVVRRDYLPNILEVFLTEKEVSSFWQINNKFYPIDAEGKVIEAEFSPNRAMLLIVGESAPEHINELLDIIKEDNQLYSRTKAANFISKRRWNIIIDDNEGGITIKLPQENIKSAWKKLIKLDKTMGILKRKLTIIDLRFEDKIIVRPRKFSIEEILKMQKGAEKSI